MPIYEFQCKKCDNVFEQLFLSRADDGDVKCPLCNSEKVQKLMSVFGGKIGNTSSGGCITCPATSCSTCSVKHLHTLKHSS